MPRGRPPRVRPVSPRPRPPAARGRRSAAAGRGQRSAPERRAPGATRTVRRAREEGLGGDQVEGRHAVLELFAAGRRQVRRLYVAEGLESSAQLDEIEARARSARVPVQTVGRSRLASLARTDAPQGVVALAAPLEAVELDELCEPRGGVDPFLLVLAGVTDPHNAGALLRSAECAGATGIVLPRHRSARVSPTVAKAAAGSIEHLAFASVGGVPASLERVSRLGVQVVGLAGDAAASLYDADLAGPVALVVGSEDRGLAPLVRRRCDRLVAIPQHGAIPSLNVAAAGAVACFEVARQRERETASGIG
jgi:23S rRNA (guanosine2251-2'-O)-methyltransferase